MFTRILVWFRNGLRRINRVRGSGGREGWAIGPDRGVADSINAGKHKMANEWRLPDLCFFVLLEEAQNWLFYTAGRPCLDDFGALDNPCPVMRGK